MKKRTLLLLLLLVLCFTLIATPASAVFSYGVWVNGEEFYGNNLTVDCGSGTATYDPDKNELTLNNATITKAYDEGAIRAKDTLTVIVNGNNKINLTEDVEAFGIFTEGDVTLKGTGNLDISVENSSYDGIWADFDSIDKGDVNISMSGDLIINAGDDGIYANQSINITGSGDVKVNACTDALYAYSGSLTVSGTGDVSAISTEWESISTNKDIIFSGSGDIYVESEQKNGIYSDNGNVIISGSGKITVIAELSAVLLDKSSTKLLFNGTASPIRLRAGAGYPAVDGDIGGTKLASYIVMGDPDYEAVDYVINPFVDVKSSDYFYNPVLWAVANSVTEGTDKTHFSPAKPCTRGQIVTFLWRAAGEPAPTGNTNPFVDVKSSDYFYQAVLWAVEKGITAGMDSTHFAPSQPCTREQTVTFLWRSEGKPAAGSTNPFVDVKSTDYSYQAVLWAVDNEITAGMDSTHFAPAKSCTRGQIVTFLFRKFSVV